MKQNQTLIRNTKNSNPQNSTPTIAIDKQELYSGPIPHPDILRGLGEIDSTFPDRIITMAEMHAKSSINVENRESLTNLITPILGQIFTFLLGLSGIIASVILAVKGYTAESIAVIVGSFAPIVIAASVNLKNTKK